MKAMQRRLVDRNQSLLRRVLPSLVVTAGVIVLATPAVPAAQWYVATTGTPSGDGSIGDPWNLQRALNGTGPIAPGDTIWIRGGVYLGPFTSYLKGTPAQPIVVRNYNRERVLIDYQYYQCDNTKCPPAEWQAQNPWHPACVEDGNGNIVAGANYQCTPWAGPCTLDPATNPTTAVFSRIPYSLNIEKCSHDTWYWGLELLSAEPGGRISPFPAACSASNPTSNCCWPSGVPGVPPLDPLCDMPNPHIRRSYGGTLNIDGDNIKLVNCFIHDGNVNLPLPTAAENFEVFGSFSFNGGYVDALRGRSHGTYAQNIDCTDRPSSKLFRDTVFFNIFDLGMQAYSSGCAPVQNMLIDGVVSFQNRSPANVAYANSDPAIVPDWRTHEYAEAIYIGSQRGTRAIVRNTYTYSKVDNPMDAGIALRIDSGQTPIMDVWVEGSVFVGNYAPVRLYDIGLLRFNNNSVVAGQLADPSYGLIAFSAPGSRMAAHFPNYIIDHNSYYRIDGAPKMVIGDSSIGSNTQVPFATWQSTYGWDVNGSAATGLPTTNWIYVRPNAYEAGRAHVIVYNWLNLSSVTANLSGIGLGEGQAFKVYNVQSFKADLDLNNPDYYGNVVGTGTYSAGSPTVSISMTDTQVTSPIGFPYALPTTMPQFGVFLVLGQ